MRSGPPFGLDDQGGSGPGKIVDAVFVLHGALEVVDLLQCPLMEGRQAGQQAVSNYPWQIGGKRNKL